MPHFSPATQAWLDGAFAAPTAAQDGAWDAVARGDHTLVVAPTGSGKTLAAFLSALDRLAALPVPEEPKRRCRVLYVSPLKALAVDVERNLRTPLAGIRQAAARLGLPEPDVTVAMRSGDTSADERRLFARRPADILITTPESLFLLLTSAARDSLRGVDTVIIDEVHAVCATKRGAHLAVSLERLDSLLERPAQRIGLSATVRPIEEVATFLAGGRPVTVVAPQSQKTVELQVVVPVEDMSAIGEPTDDLTGAAAGAQRRASIWPHVEERVLDLVAGAPLDDRVRQLPPARRTPHRPAQRARHRARRDRGGRRGPAAGAADGPGRVRCVRAARSSWPERTTGRCRASSAPSSRSSSRPARCRRWSRPPRSSSASTWARWTSSSRSSRRRRSRPGCSASAAPGTRSARCPAA